MELPKWKSECLGLVPCSAGKALEVTILEGGIWTALRMSELICTKREAFDAFMEEVDGIVALRDRVQTLLINNGVPQSKRSFSSGHGLTKVEFESGKEAGAERQPLRVAFLGRADRARGIDTIIGAVRGASNLKIELGLYGVAQSQSDSDYQKHLGTLAAQDERIKILPAIPHREVLVALPGQQEKFICASAESGCNRIELRND